MNFTKNFAKKTYLERQCLRLAEINGQLLKPQDERTIARLLQDKEDCLAAIRQQVQYELTAS